MPPVMCLAAQKEQYLVSGGRYFTHGGEHRWQHRRVEPRTTFEFVRGLSNPFAGADLGVVRAGLNPEVTRNEAAGLAGNGAALALRRRWILQSTVLVTCAGLILAIIRGAGRRFPIVGWRRVGRCLRACS